VSFQDGPPQEIDDLYRSSPDPTKRPLSGAGKQSKWQPLSSVDPSPVADADPFSLDDSDDEKDAKNKDIKADDTRRLKKAAAEAMADDIGSGARGDLAQHERSGGTQAKDREADEILAAKS